MQSSNFLGESSFSILNNIEQPTGIGSVAFTQDQINRIERQRPTDFLLTPPPSTTPDLTTDLAETEKFFESISSADDVTTETVLPPVITTASPLDIFQEDNPLHSFASYTYNITLCALKPSEYNEMMQNPDTAYVPQHVLMSSGSRRIYNRDPRFDKDFYIEDLRFETVIGLNSQTKGSNVVKMQFTIREPMGVSLFDRLLDMSRGLGIENYLEIPYLIMIEYFGNLDDGSLVQLSGHRKYIPIKIVAVKLNIKNSGAEYSVDAVPFNHVAFMSEGTGTTPANLQIPAKTVGDFFSSVAMETIRSQLSAVDKEREEQINDERMGKNDTWSSDPWAPKDVREAEQKQRKSPVIYNSSSYTSALNEFEQYSLEKEVISIPHIYKFAIDEEIANAEIINYPELPSGRVFQDGELIYRGPNSDSNSGKVAGMFSVKAGMSVIDVINMVIKSSSYIKDNLLKPENATEDEIQNGKAITVEKAKPPIDWFKITPVVNMLPYDEKRNIYACEITYVVQKYKMHNTKSPLAKKTVPKEVITQYNYIFTGDNKDILDLQIDFDVLFYILATVGKTKWENANDSPVTNYQNPETKNLKNNTNIAFQPATVNVSDHSSHHSDGSTETQEKIAVSDFWNSMISSSRGDMINVRLKILGDPRYIKQDDFYFNRLNRPITGDGLSENNSILYDSQERYVQLNFKTPSDYDDSTGMLETNSKYSQSGFSGIYRVIMVENNFVGGKFEQTLDMVRIFDQEPDQNPAEIKNEQRTESTQDSVQRSDLQGWMG